MAVTPRSKNTWKSEKFPHKTLYDSYLRDFRGGFTRNVLTTPMKFEINELSMIHHPTGFIRKLNSANHLSGTQNGDAQGKTITSTQKIGDGRYTAINQVILLPGFEATAKDAFLAKIGSVSAYQWQYVLKDHLGNQRALFTDKNGDGLLQQSTDENQNEVLALRNYSAFGLELGGSNQNINYQNPYKYTGKEENSFTGYYDFGARWSDPTIGNRFLQIDPLAEIVSHLSLYQYGNLNPILFNDPTGMVSQRVQDLNGNWHEVGGNEVINVYTEGGENGDEKEKQGYYTNGVMRPTSQQNAIIKPTEPKKFGTHFTPEEKAGHQGVYLGAEIIVGETVLGFLKIGQWLKSLFSLADEATQVILKNTLPISTEGKLLGSISNGKISMYGKTLASGKFDFVVMLDGQILLGRKHTFLSGGADVLAAGELKIRGGNIVGINNLSGHYMPNLNVSSNYLNIFKKSGVDVSKAHLQIYNSQGEIIKHILPR
ncbi:MAG TPA: hypothetical protein DCM71_20420 [Runella sp.]|nr:hypothetical protein [Runella sp.]